MKAAVLHRYDPELRNKEFLVYEEIDDPPAPGPGEVIVKIQAAGVCRTDLCLLYTSDAADE